MNTKITHDVAPQRRQSQSDSIATHLFEAVRLAALLAAAGGFVVAFGALISPAGAAEIGAETSDWSGFVFSALAVLPWAVAWTIYALAVLACIGGARDD